MYELVRPNPNPRTKENKILRAGSHKPHPVHLRSICAILAVESMGLGSATSHCPKYDMDVYMAILFGGET